MKKSLDVHRRISLRTGVYVSVTVCVFLNTEKITVFVFIRVERYFTISNSCIHSIAEYGYDICVCMYVCVCACVC